MGRVLEMEAQENEMFIDGYFSQRMMNGETPDYGYPKNHLPQVSDMEMTVKSGFMSSRTL